MKYIRLCLEEDMDVDDLAKPEYSVDQMAILSEILEPDDLKYIANPNFSVEQMKEIA